MTAPTGPLTFGVDAPPSMAMAGVAVGFTPDAATATPPAWAQLSALAAAGPPVVSAPTIPGLQTFAPSTFEPADAVATQPWSTPMTYAPADDVPFEGLAAWPAGLLPPADVSMGGGTAGGTVPAGSTLPDRASHRRGRRGSRRWRALSA